MWYEQRVVVQDMSEEGAIKPVQHSSKATTRFFRNPHARGP